MGKLVSSLMRTRLEYNEKTSQPEVMGILFSSLMRTRLKYNEKTSHPEDNGNTLLEPNENSS